MLSPERSEGMGTRGRHVNRCASSTCGVPRPLRRWATCRITSPARTRPTFGRLELLGLIEDYRQGFALQQAHNTVRTVQKPLPPLVRRLLPRRAPSARGPEPLPGARAGAPAGLPPSVSQGADAAQSCVGCRLSGKTKTVQFPTKMLTFNQQNWHLLIWTIHLNGSFDEKDL